MAEKKSLCKYKLGELIHELYVHNTELRYGIESVRGISNSKEIMASKADVDESVLHKFYVVYPGEFIYNPRTTRMGDKVGLAYNDTTEPLLFSFNNIAFAIKDSAREILLGEYLYLYFNRSEFDRYAITNSWGSATELFTFEEMCDIDIELPDLATQQKYVDIYKAMIANQQSYERGLDDLKLVCDAYIEDLRRKMPCEKIGRYISECNERNEGLKILDVKGVESSGSFVETKANTDGLDFSNYKIVDVNQFGYNPSRINLGSIALKTDKKCIVSPMYIVFKIDNPTKLIPEYLMLWLSRSEFRRSTQFYTSGSVRDTFGFSEMQEVEIPIPEISVQKSIANMYNVYIERKRINEQLKTRIKDICPILIRGSLNEGE